MMEQVRIVVTALARSWCSVTSGCSNGNRGSCGSYSTAVVSVVETMMVAEGVVVGSDTYDSVCQS